MVAQEELIMVCIDNSQRTSRNFRSLLEAIHFYCHAKLKSNPKTAVGVVAMALDGLEPFGRLLYPTSDLDEIMYRVQGIACSGDLHFLKGILSAKTFFRREKTNVQKRILIFTGGPTNMGFDCAKVCGNNLKEMGIAVDLVNFFCLEDEHKCGRRALNLFVASVNNNENSHIKHVLPGSSIRDVLSSTPPIITREEIAAAGDLKRILKRIPCLPRKEKVMKTVDMKLFLEEVTKKLQAAADDEYVPAQRIKYGKHVSPGLANKFKVLSC